MSIEVTQFFQKYSTIEIEKNIWSNLLEHEIINIAAKNSFKVIKRFLDGDRIKLVLEKII